MYAIRSYYEQYSLQTLGLQMGLVASAAGCPYDCNFCCISPITGGRYLTAEIDTVVRDIQTLEQTPVVRLVDANSFGNSNHALKLADAIAAAGIKKHYAAGFSGGVSMSFALAYRITSYNVCYTKLLRWHRPMQSEKLFCSEVKRAIRCAPQPHWL